MTPPGEFRDGPGPPGPDREDDDGPGEPPLTDPAHRAARWAMILTPVVLGVLVYLLLRVSTR